VRNPDCRPNAERAVYVQGFIDQQMVDRLTPAIISLQSQNRDPITVYIDSPGGAVSSMETLLKLLTVSNQDFAPACRLITVVTSRAASAAADMLSSGDYAIAFPQSTVLYHGIRTSQERPLTVEVTSLLSQMLRLANDNYAMELARKIEFRFMFRFITTKAQFDEVRAKHQPKQMTDLECFLDLISEKLSEPAKKVLQQAKERYERYDDLLNSVLRRSERISGNKRIAEIEAVRIKAIVDYEVRKNRKNKDWSFQYAGLTRLTDDFFLLNEHLSSFQSERLKTLCVKWSGFLLSQDQSNEIARLPEDQRNDRTVGMVRPVLQPVWSFFVALCHALQEGENDLTARDAFWLGLIDEVMGVADLPAFRFIAEYELTPAKGQALEAGSEEKAEAAAT